MTAEMDDRFVRHLEKLRDNDDRGSLARLRRGLGKKPGSVAEMHSLVLPWVPTGIAAREEDNFYAVAALFASHPTPHGRGSVGSAFAQLMAANDGAPSVESRFTLLLNSHVEDLNRRLRQAVSLLESKDIPVDWRRLLGDLRHWDHPNRFVQRKWARDFWASQAFAQQDTATSDQAPRGSETDLERS